MKRLFFILFSLCLFACTSQEGLVSVSQQGNLKVTSIQLKGAAYSTPVKTANNTVVLGTHKRSVYFLTEDSIKQQYKTNFWVHATPAIVYDSLISIGSYDGNMYFFNEDGELQKTLRPGGRIFTNSVQLDSLWMVFATGFKGLWYYNMNADSLFFLQIKKLTHGSPTVFGNNLVCVGSNDKKMYIFDKVGNLMSTFKTDGWIMHSKALPQSDSVIVFGSYDNSLYSISTSGSLKWRFQTNGKIHGSPQQFDNGNIICGSFDKHIYVLNGTGQKISEIQTGKRVVSSAAIVNGKYAVIGSYDKCLYLIDSNGELLEKIDIGGKIFSSPIVVDSNTIFCATTNGKAVYITYNKPSSQKL
ncbi:MAG: PQQ-binding-like beta-propeller repeat protein [Bacteroidales bacterium]|nr:PQQ-binding-like beta-propeller repeat protein [Bacteroidales bacterium]